MLKVKAVTQWVKVETIQLYENDKKNLILQSGWIDDKVINAAQALLKSRTHTPGRAAVHKFTIKSKV